MRKTFGIRSRSGVGVTILLVLSLGVFLSACRAPLEDGGVPDLPTERVCTEIGCVSGVTLDLAGDVPEEFSLIVTVPGEDQIAARCPAGEAPVHCLGDHVLIEQLAADEFTVQITWEEGDFAQTFMPTYEEVQPNGPSCPPICQQASVTINLSSMGGEQDINSIPPPATLEVNGRQQVAGIGTYCWPTVGETAALCVDKIGVPTAQEPLVVQSPVVADLALPLDRAPDVLSLSVAPVSEADELDSSVDNWRWWAYVPGEDYALSLAQQQDIELMLDPGLYVLRVFAQWQDVGDVTYGFLLDVP